VQAAEALGLDVPGELSVLGSDDIPAASMVSPGLTTIASPLIAKGEEAGRILLGQTTEKPTRILPFELIMRASTGTPPPQQSLEGVGS
jgi:DNA-binding LacI/PurR family transcriptional regulator